MLREEAFGSDPALLSQVLSEMCGVFSSEKLLSNSGEEVQSGSDNSILFSGAIEPLPSPQIGKGFSHVQY